MERREWQQSLRRLRWRLRGAWQWPAFIVLTTVDGVLLWRLPFYEGAPDRLVGGLLLAGFANLLVVAVLAPLAGRALRRRRPDLPRMVASNYAGTALLVVVGAGLLIAGLARRPAIAAADAERMQVLMSVHRYVSAEAPQLQGELAATDAVKLEPGRYRACVPKPQPRRFLCLFVNTSQSPPGITRDRDETSNAGLR